MFVCTNSKLSAQRAQRGTLLQRNCAWCCKYSILLAFTIVFCLLAVPVVSFSIYSSPNCVCARVRVPVFIPVQVWACAFLVCVMGYWSRPAEVAGPQVQSIKTMGNLSWERCISQEPFDWLLPRSRLPWWRIRSELRLCLHQWWGGTGAISLLLRAIDSIGQRRL